MDVAAVVLIGIGILLGATMAYYVLQGHHIPKGLAFMHGGAVVTGVLLLVIYALTTEAEHKHWGNIIVFLIAAVGGLYMFSKDVRHKQFPIWLMVVHAVIGLGGFIWLAAHLID